MDLKNIQELVKLVKKTDISELSVKEGDFSITIKNVTIEHHAVISHPAHVSTPVSSGKATVTTHEETKNESGSAAKKAEAAAQNDNIVTFRSPMVGTFYRKPGADKDPFVKIGDPIKPGDVLCIIEAMKLFNEIEFDGVEGTILKVLVQDASPVEYDQPLFLIEKS
jgi:acetyl-CoA carboxylase biotin carboxyl carrier protein